MLCTFDPARIGARIDASARFAGFRLRDIEPEDAPIDDDGDGASDVGPPGDNGFDDPDDGDECDPSILERGLCARSERPPAALMPSRPSRP